MNLKNFPYSRLVRWIFRFRQRCGYGIHSPYAFNLVTGVFYEKTPYYAYHELSRIRPGMSSGLRLKDKQLLFRLVNFAQPSSGLMIGDNLGCIPHYLQAAKRSCEWHSYLTHDVSHAVSDSQYFDFIYIDDVIEVSSLLIPLLDSLSVSGFIVLRNIHLTAAHSVIWQSLLSDSRVRVTFDLFDFGVLVFEPRLNKENYIINYF